MKNVFKSVVFAGMLAVASLSITSAHAVPCLDGIKASCDGPPNMSWGEYMTIFFFPY